MTLDQAIEIWFHYEEIAMHFNELIIQYRLHLMGGAGLIGALSGYLVGSKVHDREIREKLRAWISLGLLTLILAAAYLDLYYYNQLLRGAVDALIEFEKAHPELYMSTRIKAKFPDGATSEIRFAYGLFILPLAAVTLWSWWVVAERYCKKKQ